MNSSLDILGCRKKNQKMSYVYITSLVYNRWRGRTQKVNSSAMSYDLVLKMATRVLWNHLAALQSVSIAPCRCWCPFPLQLRAAVAAGGGRHVCHDAERQAQWRPRVVGTFSLLCYWAANVSTASKKLPWAAKYSLSISSSLSRRLPCTEEIAVKPSTFSWYHIIAANIHPGSCNSQINAKHHPWGPGLRRG